jgi:hypothetical protein
MSTDEDILIGKLSKNDIHIRDNLGCNIDNDISLSWSEMINEEKGSCDREFFKLSKEIIADDIINVNDVLNMADMSTIEDENILKYQVKLVNNLRSILKEKPSDEQYNEIKMCIKWLMASSKYLSDKNKLKSYKHNNDFNKDKTIPRSSYKFCEYAYQCEFNYNKKKYNGCYAQHYVHNMLNADLISVDEFMEFNASNINSNFVYHEIRKSINTISYVCNHMYEEYKNVKSNKPSIKPCMEKNFKKNKH